MTGVVINYFNPTKNKALFTQTELCITAYLSNNDCFVLLSDGSGIIDNEMVILSKQIKFIYLASQNKLSFAQGYNQGVDYFLDKDEIKYIVLSANDIIVDKDTVQKLLNCHCAGNNIGCVIPYLSESDYHLQNKKFAFKDRQVPLMTLNCNLFFKDDLIKIGKVPAYLSGYFNDVVMASKLFEIGKSILIVKNIVVIHLARKTTSVSTTANFIKDKEIFMNKHACLSIKKDDFIMNASKFSNNKGELFYCWLQKVIPFRFITDRIYYYKYNLEVIGYKFKNWLK